MSAALEWTPADSSPVVVPDHRRHPCSRCGGPRNVPRQAYCRSCHAIRMREQRAKARAELVQLRQLFHVSENVSRETSAVSG